MPTERKKEEDNLGKVDTARQDRCTSVNAKSPTFAPGARYAVAQDAPEKQRARVQVVRAPRRRHGTSAQFAAFLFGHVVGQQVFAQAVFAHRSPAHSACRNDSCYIL